MFIKFKKLNGTEVTVNTDHVLRMYPSDGYGRVCQDDAVFEVTPETYNRIEQALKVVDLTKDKAVEGEWEVGDIVEIIARENGHKFMIGEHVRILAIDTNESYQDFLCQNHSQTWWIRKSEACLITEQ